MTFSRKSLLCCYTALYSVQETHGRVTEKWNPMTVAYQ